MPRRAARLWYNGLVNATPKCEANMATSTPDGTSSRLAIQRVVISAATLMFITMI